MFRTLIQLRLITVAFCGLALSACGRVTGPLANSSTSKKSPAPRGVVSIEPFVSGRTFPSNGKRFDVELTSDPSTIPANRPFSLRVKVLKRPKEWPSGPLEMTVGATMPAHHHGMLVEPKCVSLGNDTFKVDGLLMHMAGDWDMTIDLRDGRFTERCEVNVHVS